MGKKRVSILGTESEQETKAKHARQLEQKKLRLGKGQRVVDTAKESLLELEEIQKRTAEIPSTTQTAKQSRVRSQPYQNAKTKIAPDKTYSITDAVQLLRTVSLTKFDPTVELHINLQESPSNQISVTLPHPTGISQKIAVFSDSLLPQIESGKIDFDLLLATPADMPKLVKFAKTLGPRGLMPNPKTGTLTPDPASALKSLTSRNSLTLRPEKSAPVIHTVVGKLSFSDSDLSANISAILSALTHTQKVVLKSTMSPAIKISV
ncbi:hypothetical protein HYS82_01500 [Candidatus Amesbacteria bacterium]|nr:hypothetical protein [Candidatus Amesbacteria bacterium]MBI2587516.1 hypothetical protein [Candidatus Amesbacteria bacterium]